MRGQRRKPKCSPKGELTSRITLPCSKTYEQDFANEQGKVIEKGQIYHPQTNKGISTNLLVPRVNNAKKRWGWCYDAKYKIIRYHIITNLMTSHLFLDPQFSPPHFGLWVCHVPYLSVPSCRNEFSVSQLLSHWFRISQLHLDCGHFRDFCFYPRLSFGTYLLTKYGLCDPAPPQLQLTTSIGNLLWPMLSASSFPT